MKIISVVPHLPLFYSNSSFSMMNCVKEIKKYCMAVLQDNISKD
jgi:hypothetical protein